MPLTTTVIPCESRPPDKRLLKLADSAHLPNPLNGTMLVLGMAGAGKSSFIYSFYNHWTANYFDELVVFCATKDSAETWSSLKQRNIVVLHEYTDAVLEKYLKDLEQEQIKRIREKKYPLRVSILFDDMAGANITRVSKPTAVDRLALNCRHYNVFLVITSQRFRLISNTLRQNTHYVVLYKTARPDLERVAEEFADPLDEATFLKLAINIVETKHDYLVIDLRANPNNRFRHQMNEIIDTSGLH